MELHPPGRLARDRHAHHHAGIAPCNDLQRLGQIFTAHRQGMITRRLERVGNPGEDALVSMVDRLRLAVGRGSGRNDSASQTRGDHLMAETDPQYRDLAAIASQCLMGK